MTTGELYSWIGVAGYEHQGCWRKEEKFHIRLEGPPTCYKCLKCGKWEVIHRGTFDRVVHVYCSSSSLNAERAATGPLRTSRKIQTIEIPTTGSSKPSKRPGNFEP